MWVYRIGPLKKLDMNCHYIKNNIQTIYANVQKSQSWNIVAVTNFIFLRRVFVDVCGSSETTPRLSGSWVF